MNNNPKESVTMSNVAKIKVSDSLTTSAPSIASAAMLVELSISVWTGRKKDRNASKDVTTRAGADEAAANVTKKLLGDCEELTALQKFAANLRNRHYHHTMPWSNSGLRLIPTALYFGYHEEMTGAQSEFYKLVEDFIASYQWEVSRAQVKLGSLFNQDDYPSADSLRRKFAFSLNYMPLPSAGDFRVDVGNEQAAALQEQYESFYTKQIERAMQDVWQRTYEVLARMSERLDYAGKDDRKKFHDSLVGNVLEMVDLLEACNVTDNSDMQAMQRKLKLALTDVTPDKLRVNDSLRIETKKKIDEAIAALPSWDD